MSVFTTVTREQLGAWLKNYSIGTLIALEGIPAGIENTNYFVTTAQGRYVLTLFEKLKARELPFYLNLMAHLAGHGIPCPRPDREPHGRLSRRAERQAGRAGELSPRQGRRRAYRRQCAQAGAMLASIHLAGASYAGRMDNPRGPKWWTSVHAGDPAVPRRGGRGAAAGGSAIPVAIAPRGDCRAGRYTPISSATTCCSRTDASRA